MAHPISSLPHSIALKGRDPINVQVIPDDATLSAVAERLELLGLRKMRATLRLTPEGKRDWALTGNLGATVVQPCVVTLDPVTTRIETPLAQRYLANYEEPEGAEVETPQDETANPLPEAVEIGFVLEEALALALPDFPRAEGAELGEAVFAAPGVEPMRDEDAKPFAGLADLKAKLAQERDPE